MQEGEKRRVCARRKKWPKHVIAFPAGRTGTVGQRLVRSSSVAYGRTVCTGRPCRRRRHCIIYAEAVTLPCSKARPFQSELFQSQPAAVLEMFGPPGDPDLLSTGGKGVPRRSVLTALQSFRRRLCLSPFSSPSFHSRSSIALVSYTLSQLHTAHTNTPPPTVRLSLCPPLPPLSPSSRERETRSDLHDKQT